MMRIAGSYINKRLRVAGTIRPRRGYLTQAQREEWVALESALNLPDCPECGAPAAGHGRCEAQCHERGLA